MVSSFECSCCSSPLLRHVRASQIYWYCTHCHQEMPAINELDQDSDSVGLEEVTEGALMSLRCA
jgi:Zn finger protein HypA/HybF involved in hydrogenase expression